MNVKHDRDAGANSSTFQRDYTGIDLNRHGMDKCRDQNNQLISQKREHVPCSKRTTQLDPPCRSFSMRRLVMGPIKAEVNNSKPAMNQPRRSLRLLKQRKLYVPCRHVLPLEDTRTFILWNRDIQPALTLTFEGNEQIRIHSPSCTRTSYKSGTDGVYNDGVIHIIY